jgi:hypothetical protein
MLHNKSLQLTPMIFLIQPEFILIVGEVLADATAQLNSMLYGLGLG